MKNYLVLLLMVFVLSSCASQYSPVKVAVMDPLQLTLVPDQSLCTAYSYKQSDHIWQEIQARSLINNDRSLIDSKHVSIGMSECALNAMPDYVCRFRVGETIRDGEVVIYNKTIWKCDQREVITVNGIVESVGGRDYADDIIRAMMML